MNAKSTSRRRWVGAAAGLAAAGLASAATNQTPAASNQKATSVLGGAGNKIVYQLNQADPHYQEDVLNSVSALLSKYVDDIQIAVAVWGPAIHLLAKNPKRPVAKLLQDRTRSMAEFYGVRFIACNNTLRSLGWSDKDLHDFVQIEEFGAATIMRLQQEGYAYLAW